MISIRMLKLSGPSLCKFLSSIFKLCPSQMKFPMEWKKANVVLIHRKNNKQCIKNYQPVPLLPICCIARGWKWVFNVNLYMNTEWNVFAEIKRSSNNNFRDVATSQALGGNIPILFSFQNRENRENLTSQILKNFQLVQT